MEWFELMELKRNKCDYEEREEREIFLEKESLSGFAFTETKGKGMGYIMVWRVSEISAEVSRE